MTIVMLKKFEAIKKLKNIMIPDESIILDASLYTNVPLS